MHCSAIYEIIRLKITCMFLTEKNCLIMTHLLVGVAFNYLKSGIILLYRVQQVALSVFKEVDGGKKLVGIKIYINIYAYIKN